MNWYTVIGFYPDSNQRFAESVLAKSGAGAEALIGNRHPGLNICGVVEGNLFDVGASDYVEEYLSE